MNLYDSALWTHYCTGSFKRQQSCYNKCLNLFFGYSKRYSVTQMLLELSLPSLNTTIANGHALAGRISVACNNRLVQFVCLLGLVL